MPHCATFFDTPELASIVSSLLDKADLARLCRTSKSLRSNFSPLLWRHYTISNHNLSGDETLALLEHSHLLRVLEIIDPITSNDPDILALAEGLHLAPTSQLTHLTLRKNENFFSSYSSVSGALFRSVFSLLRYNHSLRELNLATRLVLDYADQFLEAFLALKQLESLRIEMISLSPTFPTALNMAVTLIDRHPRLEHILFGDWVGSVDIADWLQLDYEDSEDEDLFPGRNCIASEEEIMEAIAKRIVKKEGTHHASDVIKNRQVRTIELPPRQQRPYPTSFLKILFGEGRFPNLSKLLLPNAVLATISLETLRIGCPRLKSMVTHSIRRGSAHVGIQSFSSAVVTVTDKAESGQ